MVLEWFRQYDVAWSAEEDARSSARAADVYS